MFLKRNLVDFLTFKNEKINRNVFLLIVLPILIFYLLSISGITYSFAGFQKSMYINSGGDVFDAFYISDKESVAAIWLKNVKLKENEYIYSDYFGPSIVTSQAMINNAQYAKNLLEFNEEGSRGVFFMRRHMVENNKVLLHGMQWRSYENYYRIFAQKDLIYSNGDSKIVTL